MISPAPQFFLPALHGGGAESHLLRLLNAWPQTSPLPGLWLARPGGSYESQLRDDVERHAIHSTRRLGSTLGILSCVPALRRRMRGLSSPVCPVLDFAVLALDLARRGLPSRLRPPLVILLQNNLSAMLADLPAPWKILRPALLRAHRDSDGVVFSSAGVRADFEKLIPGHAGKTATIPNAAWSAELEARSHEACPIERMPGRQLIVACGRLHRQKGFDLLLRAFAKIALDSPRELWLLGEGPDRAALESLAAALGIADSVRFLGFQANPLPCFRAADLFVLSSRWEGFGNVIVEALGSGVPVISTDCPFGPAEILEHGRWGRLVPVENVQALAEGMRGMLGSPEQFRSGLSRARHFEARSSARAYADFLHSFSA